MPTYSKNRSTGTRGSLTRRDFLRVGSLTAGLGLAGQLPLRAETNANGRARSCILLFLVGGPSQLDTWDPKPDAPEEVRGPFRPTRTTVPGMHLCETFPLMAGMAERFAVVRSVHHEAAAIHETGHQLMQTGGLWGQGGGPPHVGSVVSRVFGPGPRGLPSFVILPRLIGYTGVRLSHGQGAGFLGAAHEPFVLDADPASSSELCAARERLRSRSASLGAERAFDLSREKPALRERYGAHTIGQSCLLARRLVEHGVRFVTVNLFETVFNELTWDCHADGGSLATTLEDYRDTLCPLFDRAYTALLEDLAGRGLLESTLVVATGEFGRAPKLNPRGGRDHWPGVWSMLFAGGGVRGGRVVGASDRLGAEPRDRPVCPGDVLATVYQQLGINPTQALPTAEGGVIRELLS